MKAVDTNILARFFIDDPNDEEAIGQRPAAIAAMSERVFVGITVLLEFEWVMRGFYGLGREEVGKVMAALCDLSTVIVEDRDAVAAALAAHAAGLDFADALHLARAARCQAFVSFDTRLGKRAEAIGMTPVCEIPVA